MLTLENILVATDFSEPSAVALNYGRKLARASGAPLHVLHIVEDLITRYTPEIAYAMPEMQKEMAATATQDLHALITDDDRRTLKVLPVVLTAVNMADAIVNYARTKAVDLIITGTHGRGGVTHLLMGSVAERVVRTAPCPVLTVREHERDFITADSVKVTATA